jgi:hypothetical protein
VTIWDTSGLAKPHLGNSSFQANQRKMFIWEVCGFGTCFERLEQCCLSIAV